MALFFRSKRAEDPERAAVSRRLNDLARAALALGEDDALTVSEIACGDPACGGAETVILVMRVGARTKALKLAMPMAQVTEDALRRAAEEAA
ncbi:hypothetical protein GCM10008171_20340 [Methylopila jiangsuensis]|uniref:Nitrate reductase n=1 Tax=Methylopila jiangsuensis TaxID=586230 RepID=A0A9W6N3X7_9HYPH|nr:hypothetical protein [Methylopila jiangsuensis]MDR6286873.1 hypothetical protein [Methylopila jiangsuensis]GLK76780.1 hypothetical protein GCM10008171_20340 [Methylopila jiangsuensis]